MIAVIGLYGLLAPLRGWWPWLETDGPHRTEHGQLDEDDLRALATELNDFLMERRAGIEQVSGDQANRYEIETRRIYKQRFQARAFQMCDRLHTRGWITDAQWENLRGFDIRLTLPGERIVDVARRFGALK